MNEKYTKIFTDSTIIVKALQTLLDESKIKSRISDRVESARLGGYGIPTNSVELFILSEEVSKAKPIVDSFKDKINS